MLNKFDLNINYLNLFQRCMEKYFTIIISFDLPFKRPFFIPLSSQFFSDFVEFLQERKSVSGFYIVQKIFGCVGAYPV
ncbi:MAG: hypothetical protein K0R77_3065 [Chryseobacterium sp.]|jgi:hypothetical protein|nr:hypothetical protein [Chryseobacterium sp.]